MCCHHALDAVDATKTLDRCLFCEECYRAQTKDEEAD